MNEAIVAAILASLCILTLMFGGVLVFVVYTSNKFAQQQVEDTRKFSEKLFLFLKAGNVGDAVNAATTLEHNREALRQESVTFERALAKDNEAVADPKPGVIIKDQITGHEIEVVT